MAKLHRTPLVLALACGLVLPALALAGTDTPPAAPADSGMKAAIDKNGNLRSPTAEEEQELAKKQTQKRLGAATGPVGKPTVSGHNATQPRSEREAMATYKASPSGMRTMAVPEDLMSTMTVTRGADGKLSISENQSHGQPAQEVADE